MWHLICHLEAVSENVIGWNVCVMWSVVLKQWVKIRLAEMCHVTCDLSSWSSEWKYDWLECVMWLVLQDPEGREGDVWGGIPCLRGDGASEGPPESARGPQVGPERPDVSLSASEATDAGPGEVRTTTQLGFLLSLNYFSAKMSPPGGATYMQMQKAVSQCLHYNKHLAFLLISASNKAYPPG